MENLIDQLVEIYLERETWHEKKLTAEEAGEYFEVLALKDRVILCLEYGKVLGYIEYWNINYEQFGRILCHQPFNIWQERIDKGPIAYLANVFINHEARHGWVYKHLRNEFFRRNLHCDYLVGEALRKKTQPVKVFKMQDAYKKWAQEKVDG